MVSLELGIPHLLHYYIIHVYTNLIVAGNVVNEAPEVVTISPTVFHGPVEVGLDALS